MRTRTAIVGAIVAVTVPAGGAFALAAAGASDDFEPATRTAADLSVEAEIPAQVSSVLREQGISVEPVSGAEAAARSVKADREGRADAIEAVRVNYGLDQLSEAQSVTLASMTTKTPLADSEDAASSRPEYEQRLVWLVTLDGVPNPYRGPMNQDPDYRPNEVPGIMVSPVDAETGEVLFALLS